MSCESCRGWDGRLEFGEHLLEGGWRPSEWMGGDVPFGDEGLDPVFEFVKIRKIRSGESFSLEDREPLLDLIHPRTVNGREMKAESWMLSEPSLNLLALVQDQVVADDVNERDRARRVAIEGLEKFDEVFLTFSSPTDSGDRTAPSIKSSEQLKGAAALILVFEMNRKSGLGRARDARSRPRLERGLLIYTKYALVRFQISCVEIAHVLGPATKLLVSRCLGAQPVVYSPRLESIRGQNALNRLRRDGLNQPVSLERASQFCTGP